MEFVQGCSYANIFSAGSSWNLGCTEAGTGTQTGMGTGTGNGDFPKFEGGFGS